MFRGATYRARLSLQSDLCSTASTKSSHVTPSPQFPSPLDERKKCKDSRGVISQYPRGNRKISSVQITGNALLSFDIFKFDSPLLTAVPPRRDGAIDLFNAGLNEQNDLFLKWGRSSLQLPPSYRQHNAKLCVTAHHAGIRFGSFFQRIGFDHGAYAA